MTAHQVSTDTRIDRPAGATSRYNDPLLIRLGTFATEVVFTFSHSGCWLTIHAGAEKDRDASTVLREFLLTNGLVLPDAYEGWAGGPLC